VEILEQFVSHGHRVFPLWGKKPRVDKGYDWKKWPEGTGKSWRDISGNYGVHCEKILVIDVDVKDNAKGKESYKHLTADLGYPDGWERETMVVRTGTGGFHVYLGCPDVPTQLYLRDYPGLEFRHGPFYVVGPGSTHPETKKVYEIVCGDLDHLLRVPYEILELIQAAPAVTTLGPAIPEGFIDDDPLNVERFREVISTMPGATAGNRRNSVYIVACRGRDLGLSEQVCLETIRTDYASKLDPELDIALIASTVKNAYVYAKESAGHLNAGAIFATANVGERIDFGNIGYDFNPKGVLLKTLNNCVNHIATIPQLCEVFRYNVFSGLVEIGSSAPWYKERGARGANFCDEDIALLKYFLCKTMKIEYARDTLFDSIVVVAHKRHYHPVRNYLTSLKWDGVSRIDGWLSRYGHAADTIYTRAIARKVLCAAVKRAFEPGCKWDYVLIIEGAQGIGKSTLCRILGRSWAGDMNLDPHEKDSISMMLGKWVIEMSEMTALRWHDANAMKSFITREKDTVRLPYERHAKDFPRQSIFIGTVNPEHVGYLNDITGNRRYWITKFNGPVDLMGLEKVADQLWAEAVQCYRQEPLFLRGEAELMQALEAQARMPEDPLKSNVVKWMRENPDTDVVTTNTVLEWLGVPMKSVNRADQSRIAQSLIEMGWQKEITREGGVFNTQFRRPRVAMTAVEEL
jgi:predicted P-loop ATPase